jgi:hypothetical protein
MGQVRTLKFIAVVVLIVICQSCNSNKDQKTSEVRDSTFATIDRKSDSVNLRNLLMTIYKWYEKNEGIDHNNLFTESYGIDTVKLDSGIREMRKTNFFSKEFLTNYKQIGLRTNQMLKQDSTLRMVGIAFPFQDFDTWHGGQGWELDWNTLTIHNLSMSADSASLKWTCSKPVETKPLEAKFKKENDKWKLSYLELMDLKMYQ